ncbi:hypothetical protein GCM10027586_07040 [Kineococcus gypseus]|uniref:hypothetical protein n=1 Tax=Kineococcus gypseus TaxID=1637102 RepID=UPI003D7F044D
MSTGLILVGAWLGASVLSGIAFVAAAYWLKGSALTAAARKDVVDGAEQLCRDAAAHR